VLATRQWVENVVIGLNLCPFAQGVLRSNDLAINVLSTTDEAVILHYLDEKACQLSTLSAQATALVVLTTGFESFLDYLDLIDLAEQLFEQCGLAGEVQIASFHPHYQFEGSEYDDMANRTNRSPYPMLHLLQESAVSDAVDRHPDVSAIPDQNMQRLRNMSEQEWETVSKNTGEMP